MHKASAVKFAVGSDFRRYGNGKYRSLYRPSKAQDGPLIRVKRATEKNLDVCKTTTL